MKSDVDKRLEKLRSPNAYVAPDLTYSDLLLLLERDEAVRAVVRQLAGGVPAEAEEGAACDAEPPVSKEFDSEPADAPPAPMSVGSMGMPWLAVPVSPPPPVARPESDLLREALAPELQLLARVRADDQLRQAWLGAAEESEGRQLVRLVAVAAQWNQILLLWDRFAERCKQAQREATAAERDIFRHCLCIHNLIWQGPQQARTQPAVLGAPFNERLHERGMAKGSTVNAEWLPGLVNVAGQVQRRPLVATS
jgi:hypothetical protein